MQARKPRRSMSTLTMLAAAVALGGCASSAGIAPTATSIAPAAVGLHSETSLPQIAADWWRAFGDDGLSAIVDRALADNPTLGVAKARVERTAAALASARAAEGLQVNGDAS